MSSKDFAILLQSGDLPGATDSYGGPIANRGLFSALARHGGYDTIHWLSSLAGRDDERLIKRLRELLNLPALGGEPASPGKSPKFACALPLDSTPACRAGMLLHGPAYLEASAWQRRHAGQERSYSLVGTFFGIAVAKTRQAMVGALLAPLEPWDAVICSSPTVQQAVRGMLENMGADLADRFGARHLPMPQLPVIPIGVDAVAMAAHASDLAARQELRGRLGLEEDAIAVLWVGRLSWFDKAFPQPMLLALELAAKTTTTPIHFLVAGWYPSPERDRPRFEEAARAHAPSVTMHWLDGNDQPLLRKCWAAADLFLSLSDTILETFGQAPVEAMAAGLPVVLSDWNGYRSLLRDGEEGILIPSLIAPPAGNGEWLALLQAQGSVDREGYGGSVAQHVAVHVGRTAEALAALIRSPERRRQLGEAGRLRARSSFDWPVVVAAHQQLFAELAARRRHGLPREEPLQLRPQRQRLPPLGQDPFLDFNGYASTVLADDQGLRCTPLHMADPQAPLVSCRLDGLLPGLRGSRQEASALLAQLQRQGTCSVAELLSEFPAERHSFLRMTLVWLAKLGRIDWLPANS